MENEKLSTEAQTVPTKSNQDTTTNNPTEDVIKSINVLIQSAMKGQKAGAYSLEEAAVIMESIKFLQTTLGGGEPKN